MRWLDLFKRNRERTLRRRPWWGKRRMPVSEREMPGGWELGRQIALDSWFRNGGMK